MDKTKIDFNYCLEQIKREINTEYKPQDIYLDSNYMNEVFSNIENSLNTLYENTRYLEDAISYCDAFLNLKINEYEQDITQTLKAIEDIRDINRNNAYIEYLCNFKDDLSVKKDRNNEVISNALYKEGALTLGIKRDTPITYSNVSKKSVFVPYYNNINNIKNEYYRSYFIEERIASKGVIETITITLDKPQTINYIDLKKVNCNIENFRVVYLNGIEEKRDYKTGIMPSAIITQIKFDLVCKNYNKSTYYVQKDKLTEDVWNRIKEYEYNYAFNIDSKIEMEEIIARVSGDKTDIYNNNIPNKNNIVEKSMYTYMFGLDSIVMKNIEQEKDSCFISEAINIGELSEKEFIQLHVEEVLDDTATIEYSILDGNVDIPILPYGRKIIKNEKLFSALPLRFNQDYSTETIIKKDGVITDITLDDAKLQMLSRFSVDYFPQHKYNYNPINSSIKIKATIRTYNKDSIDKSYLKAIKIRKYGGDVPWTDM